MFDEKRSEIIKAITKAILYELGIDYIEASAETEEAIGQTLYRVMAGSYSIRQNAENQIKNLKEARVDATIMIFDK